MSFAVPLQSRFYQSVQDSLQPHTCDKRVRSCQLQLIEMVLPYLMPPELRMLTGKPVTRLWSAEYVQLNDAFRPEAKALAADWATSFPVGTVEALASAEASVIGPCPLAQIGPRDCSCPPSCKRCRPVPVLGDRCICKVNRQVMDPSQRIGASEPRSECIKT